MDMLETTNRTDVRQKEGSGYPASGSALIGLGTGVRVAAERGPVQRKKPGDSRAMQGQAALRRGREGEAHLEDRAKT